MSVKELMREDFFRKLMKRYRLSLRIIHALVEEDTLYDENKITILKMCLKDLMNLLEELENEPKTT